MPCEIIPDILDLEMGTLEAIHPDPLQPETFRTAYPFPILRKTGETKLISLRTITLANEFIAVTFCLDLGGRIIALHDKRTGIDVIPMPKTLSVSDRGTRGASVEYGIEIVAGEGDRPNALGTVDFTTVEPANESESAELLLFEIRTGSGLSWQAKWRLSPHSAQISIEFSLLNRTQNEVVGRSGLHLWGFGDRQEVGSHDSLVFELNRGFVLSGLSVFDEPFLRRTKVGTLLKPGQVDSWYLTLSPFTGIDAVSTYSGQGVMGLHEGQLSVQLNQDLPSGKVVVQAGGQTLESPVNFSAKKLEKLDLSGISGEVSGVALMSYGDHVRLQWPAKDIHPDWIDYEPQFRDAGWRGSAYVKLAKAHISEGDPDLAEFLLETALLYNGDDPLTWWLKAAITRPEPGDDGERTELLNAHYLSPLEPALRVEGFLSQNEQGIDPNPILAPLAKDPEALIDVVCLIIEANLMTDATKLLDEALRHRDQPMLRYLWAWLHLSQSGMEFEASRHLQAAEGLPFAPPFPWRSLERRALLELADRFPSLPGLGRWADLARVFIPD